MIRKSISLLVVLTFISRIFGLCRSILLASFLGTTFIADAFMIAYKIPNLLRRFVGEGSMTAAFIPVFSDVRKASMGNQEKESVFLSKFYSLAFICLVLLCILGILLTPYIISFLYSFGDQSAEMAIFLTRYMFAYILFISMAAITQGVLNANFKFAIPASTPIVLNIIIITSVFTLKNWISDDIVFFCLPGSVNLFKENLVLLNTAKAGFAFASGVLFGGLIQFLMQLPSLFKLGYHLFWTTDFKDKHIPEIGKLMIPGLLGLGIYQINALLADPFVLAYLGEGCISALSYSNRLIEFSLGIFVISISTVILPNLSRFISENKTNEYVNLLKTSIRAVVFISIPASVGLLMLRKPLISLFFQSGLFGIDSASLVSNALFYHTPGLLVIGLYRIYCPAFYALKDTKTPVVGALFSLITNLLLCATLPKYMGIGGIALASTIATLVGSGFLIFKLQSKFSDLHVRFCYRVTFLSLISSLIMGLCLKIFEMFFLTYCDNKLMLFIFVMISVFIGGTVYFGLAILFKMDEMKLVRQKIQEKINHPRSQASG